VVYTAALDGSGLTASSLTLAAQTKSGSGYDIVSDLVARDGKLYLARIPWFGGSGFAATAATIRAYDVDLLNYGTVASTFSWNFGTDGTYLCGEFGCVSTSGGKIISVSGVRWFDGGPGGLSYGIEESSGAELGYFVGTARTILVPSVPAAALDGQTVWLVDSATPRIAKVARRTH
jgi:hypothetical protein